jgi:hypothetical protein
MKKIILTLWMVFFYQTIFTQEQSFTIAVNKDTIYKNQAVKVTFHINNLNGKFEAPTFTDFEVVGGPNVSSKFQSINGQTNQTKQYTYVLMPKHDGTLFIESALLTEANGKSFKETAPLKIVVLPFEGKIEEDEPSMPMDNFFGREWPQFQQKTRPQQEDAVQPEPTGRVKRRL